MGALNRRLPRFCFADISGKASSKTTSKGRPLNVRRLCTVVVRLSRKCAMLPIIHIDQLAESLLLTRDWIVRKWLKSDNPPPHFRDGDSVFFELEELRQWARRRSFGSDSIDTPTDP